MIKYLLPLLAALFVMPAAAQKNKGKGILPRDSITDKFCYTDVGANANADKAALQEKLEKWIKQNYNTDEEHTTVAQDGDTWTIHDREALPQRARKFVAYDLTIDLKDGRYRYKLTNLMYTATGTYPLEDKMATDKKSDLREIDEILERVLGSLNAALQSEW
ncbi:MAG: DUF4468 domain-containing protein [Flavobacteriales bacterium]|nr:DUF4468 domain-containing protein [Flavobacteriales bacterium]HPF67451.1 DUF4468 domain-containing protein [Flavobacteriales bacterium]HPJ52597.1 DUF4468 domain-containing protein [Flavobacteriales bacterium]